MRHFPYEIAGVATRTGDVVSMDEWAAWARIPSRLDPSRSLSGEELTRILGIESKSWSPQLFRDPERVIDVARQAMDAACVLPSDIDAALMVTCTPYEVMLDQDAFRMLNALKVPDHVVPMLLYAGCAGMARAMAVAAHMTALTIMVLTYSVPSLFMTGPDGEPNPVYRINEVHEQAGVLWASPGLFSDGVAVIILRRTDARRGLVNYSRDTCGVSSSLVRFPGGGALHPAGFARSAEQSAFGMVSGDIRHYYMEGMRRNHRDLLAVRPGYLDEMRRIYTHQASPGLVSGFLEESGMPVEKIPQHAERLGNLTTPCTMTLLHDDLLSGAAQGGDEICVSVVGAGPERGAFIAPLAESVKAAG